MEWILDPVQTFGLMLTVCALVALALVGFKLPQAPRLDGYANEWAKAKGKRR